MLLTAFRALHFTVLHLAAKTGGYSFNIVPDSSAPGASAIEKLTNQAAFWALLAAGVGAVLSIIMIAVGKGLHLERIHSRGKEGVIVAVIALVFVASINAVLNAAYSA